MIIVLQRAKRIWGFWKKIIYETELSKERYKYYEQLLQQFTEINV